MQQLADPQSTNPAEGQDKLLYIPMYLILPSTKEDAILDRYQDSLDRVQVYAMFKKVVDDGQYYPVTGKFDDKAFDRFLMYSREVFVLRRALDGNAMGMFFVRSNFPGRSSHICNGGFVVSEKDRNKGIGELLYKLYLRIARDLGYEGSLFNLIYATNAASLRLCRKLGFKEIGVIPKGGKLEGLGCVDIIEFYYDLTTLNDRGEPDNGWPCEINRTSVLDIS